MIAIVKLILEVLSLAKELFKLFKEAEKKKWVDEGRTIVNEIKNAKTDDERKNLVRRLSGNDSDMP